MKDISWRKEFKDKTIKITEFIDKIPDVSTVFVGTGAGEPSFLVNTLSEKAVEKKLNLLFGWSFYPAPYSGYLYKPSYFFITKAQREDSIKNKIRYIPTNIGSIPFFFRQKKIPVDVALIQVSPPDEHGYMSMGVSVDFTREAVKQASIVIAQVNQYMPYTYGDTFLTYKDVDFFVKHSEPLIELKLNEQSNQIQEQIAFHLSKLIPNGATISSGLSKISSSVIKQMNQSNIKIHSLIISDWVKALYTTGKLSEDIFSDFSQITTSHAIGSADFYDFINRSPMISMKTVDYILSPQVISKIDNFISIGEAFQMDLSGQMFAGDDTGGMYSSITNSGSIENLITLSKGGKSILVMQSLSKKGESNITDYIKKGSTVLKSMNNMDFVVSEYGTTKLKGKTITERATSLIKIAHPSVRQELASFLKNKKHFDFNCLNKKHFEFQHSKHPNIKIRSLNSIDFNQLNKYYHHKLSDSDRYQRFFGNSSEIDLYLLQKLKSKNDFILGAFKLENSNEILAGTVEVAVNHNICEIAFTVDKTLRHQGIGTLLLKALEQFLFESEIKTILAEIKKTNTPMINLMKKSIFEWKTEEKPESIIFTSKIKEK